MKDSDAFWPIMILIVILFLGGGLIYHGCQWQEECVRRGGHVISVYKSALCVDAEGRILEWE